MGEGSTQWPTIRPVDANDLPIDRPLSDDEIAIFVAEATLENRQNPGEMAESDAVPAASRVRALELIGKHLGMFDGRAPEPPIQQLVIPEHWTIDDVRRLRDEAKAREAMSDGQRVARLPAPRADRRLARPL